MSKWQLINSLTQLFCSLAASAFQYDNLESPSSLQSVWTRHLDAFLISAGAIDTTMQAKASSLAR